MKARLLFLAFAAATLVGCSTFTAAPDPAEVKAPALKPDGGTAVSQQYVQNCSGNSACTVQIGGPDRPGACTDSGVTNIGDGTVNAATPCAPGQAVSAANDGPVSINTKLDNVAERALQGRDLIPGL